PMSEEERAIFQSMINGFQSRFLEVVTKGRKALPADQIKLIADGRVLTGPQAVQLGLVDQIGYLEGGIVAATKLAGLTGARGGVGLTGSLVDLLMGCTRAPVTGREQIIFYSEEKERELGLEAYRDVLRQFPLSTNPETNAMIRRVGERIAAAANKPSYDWEFAVIQDDKIINAFCLPGGKVAFFTGLLKLTQSEAGVATVIGYEVAHVYSVRGVEVS